MKRFQFWTIVFFMGWAEAKKTKFEDLITPCSRNDPNLQKCATEAAQKMLPLLANGVRDLHLIPLDPLEVPSLDFGQDTGPVSLQWKFYNASIKGCSKAKVHSVRIEKDLTFIGEFKLPRFELSGDYVGKGKILLLPIDGKGFGNITATNMWINITFNCEKTTRKNVEYLNVKKAKLTFAMDKSHLGFSNLFGGNKELGRATNTFLNEHAGEIVDELRGTLEAVFSQLNKQLLNSVFNNIPYKSILKP